jgi:hypothetical protein
LSSHPFLDRAGCWFLHSGIQEPTGAVARYYRTDLRQNAGASTEITGYAVSTLCYLYSVTGNDEYLHRARLAADFLADTAWDSETAAMPFEHGTPNHLTYFFDCGIIIRGLLAIYRLLRREEWLECAGAVGESMQRHFRTASGEYHPILRLPAMEPLPADERWSRNAGCYQLKSALGWLELAAETGQEQWKELYEEVLRSSLAAHSAFPTLEPQRERVMDRLHAYCYFLEGLLVSAERPESARTLREGIETTAHHLREIGPEFARSDVYAQLLRLRLYADALGVLPLHREAAEQENRCLATFQVHDADLHQRGGFCFGRRNGMALPFCNPVSTAFGMQALHMKHEYDWGRPAHEVRALI